MQNTALDLLEPVRAIVLERVDLRSEREPVLFAEPGLLIRNVAPQVGEGSLFRLRIYRKLGRSFLGRIEAEV